MNARSVELYYRELGNPEAPPVILLHGLFGSSVNWLGIARRLESGLRLIVPDLRNHGRSPHTPEMSYELMRSDLLQLMQRLELAEAHLVGHSMGGKLAMWLALCEPQRVTSLVVADSAPSRSPDRFGEIIRGTLALELECLPDRATADKNLALTIKSPKVRNYLLQNLQKGPQGWFWRCNLEALSIAISEILGFPDPSSQTYNGKTLFIHGDRSDYLGEPQVPVIRALFPLARLRLLSPAGHWVYADQPEIFAQVVGTFFGAKIGSG